MAFVPDKPQQPAGRFTPDDPTKTTAYVDKRDLEAKVAAGHDPRKAEGYFPGESALRYMADWGQGMIDAATQPAGGPTGLPLVDAAAGVADFAVSAAADAVGAVPAVAKWVHQGAKGGGRSYAETREDFTRTPSTPVGKAIGDTLGATLRPVGDVITATGLPPDAAALGMDVVGTALDMYGLGAGARAAKAGTHAARPPTPKPTPGNGPFRPFGPAVEKARTLGFRLLPSQVAGAAQAAAPVGRFGFHHRVPGTIREGWTGTDYVPMAVIDNQKRVNALVAKELGISEVTPQGIAMAKNPHNAVFNEVARTRPIIVRDEGLRAAGEALGAARRNNPYLQNTRAVDDVRARLFETEYASTQQVLDAIREFRKDANTAFKKVGDVEAEQAALAYRAAANALEDALERQVGAVDPTIIPRFRDARTALAKIHNVEDALDGPNVDPQKLAKLGETTQLTGYLADIAEVATAFPDIVKSATGESLPSQSMTGSILSPSLFGRRYLGREQGPSLLRDNFQNKFGLEDPTYDPRPAPRGPDREAFTEYRPPGPDDLPPAGGTPPPSPVSGREVDQLGLVDPAENFDTLPPAEAQLGDLTASTPAPLEGIPYTPEGPTLDEIAGLRIEGQPAYPGLDYRPMNPPANPPDDMMLVENSPPPFPRNGPATPGVELPLPLDEDFGGVGIPPQGAMPFAESVGAPPATQTRPESMRVAGSLSDSLELTPVPVANSDVLPPPPVPDNAGGLDIMPEVAPGAGVIDFTPQLTDPESLAGLLDLVQNNGGLDFPQGDTQLGGRGRVLNPERRNMPRAGGRATTAEDLGLAGELELQGEPIALPAPAPLRGTESGMVGTPTQFDEMGLGTPGARAAADGGPLEGELIPAGQDLAEQMFPREDVTPPAGMVDLTDEVMDTIASTGPKETPTLAVEDSTPRAEVADLADDGMKLEKLPQSRPGDVGIKRTRNPKSDIIPRKPLPEKPIVYFSGPERNPSRWLVLQDHGDSWQLRSIDSTRFKAENPDYYRPPGRELYVTAARDARDAGVPLNSDTDMTADAINAIARAVDDGDLIVDNWNEAIQAARAALESSGGKRISRGSAGGEPWFKNIRPAR